MVATDSALRITIRIDIPDSAYPSTCIDLAVPRNSSIAEILDEVLTLADAPRISRPWQATTAAGVLIDAAQPLAHTPLTHGSTIVLSPHRDVEPPVLCDAAESFIDHGATRQHTGLTTLSTLVGIILIMCCTLSPLMGIIPLGAKFLVVALLTLVVLTRMRSTASLFNDSPDGDSMGALAALSILCLTSVICTCLGALSFIVPFPIASSQLSAVPWAGLVTALCGATMLITCHILGAPPLRLTVACATALTVIACTSAAFALTSTPSSIAATTCVIATVLVSLSPWLSLRFAGLRVPQLPSAGQDFNVADIPIDNPEARASRATALLDGILIGTSSGSTAYNYSLGGSIVDPRLNLLQVTPIAPMNTTAYRSFTSSILLPYDLDLEIVPHKLRSKRITITNDGIFNVYSGVSGIKASVVKNAVNLLRLDTYDFWNKVKTKLL